MAAQRAEVGRELRQWQWEKQKRDGRRKGEVSSAPCARTIEPGSAEHGSTAGKSITDLPPTWKRPAGQAVESPGKKHGYLQNR